jgi:hypothetical protein
MQFKVGDIIVHNLTRETHFDNYNYERFEIIRGIKGEETLLETILLDDNEKRSSIEMSHEYGDFHVNCKLFSSLKLSRKQKHKLIKYILTKDFEII